MLQQLPRSLEQERGFRVGGERGRWTVRQNEPRRILIAEDQLILGMQIAAIVEDCGFEPVEPATTVLTALPLAMREPLTAALLDVYLIDQTVEPVAAALARRGIPFGFVTAHSRGHLSQEFQTRPYVNKPFTHDDIRLLLAALTGNAPLS